MSKSYDKVNGEKVREQYFRSERLKSKKKVDKHHKKPREGDGYA